MVLKKQATVALSLVETEYIATTGVTCEAVCLIKIFRDIQDGNKGPTTTFCDSISTIAMTKNPVFHNQTKHIEIQHHFIQKLVKKGEPKLQFCKMGEQLANIFRKAIPTEKFSNFR